MNRLGGLKNRSVDLEFRTAGERDTHGNETTETTGWAYGVKARRELVTALEREQLGEFTSTAYLYFFEADVTLTERDRIHDGEVYEVRGVPSLEEGRRAPHHLEAVAEKVSG